ncbi:MAG: helix-turn-helix transcriptional regulator [Ruminococcaceae bacterium]|nr:helix-turn-helix transcriptional regulator [Oscillospiraceae bacterium]
MPEFQLSPQRRYIIEHFIKQLPLLRKKAGLRQYELADCIGKSRQKLSDIERGIAPMGWDTFLAILFVLESYGLIDEIRNDSTLARVLEKELHPQNQNGDISHH